jgi:hypothetical protein
MDTSNYSKLNPGPSGGNMGSSAFNSSAYDEIGFGPKRGKPRFVIRPNDSVFPKTSAGFS